MEGTATSSIDWNAARAVALRCGPGTRRLVEAQDMHRLALWLPAMVKVASPQPTLMYRWLAEILFGDPAGDVALGGEAA
jgi:hypothetical protein